jgi:hypothetical protein
MAAIQPARKELVSFTNDDGSNYSSGPTRVFENAATSAVTNTTTETVVYTYTFGADEIKSGDHIRFHALVQATATNGSDTLGAILWFGATTKGTALATGDLVNATNADFISIKGDIYVRDADASGTYLYDITLVPSGASGQETHEQHNGLTGSIDFTAALLLEVGVVWDNASTANSCRGELFWVEVNP